MNIRADKYNIFTKPCQNVLRELIVFVIITNILTIKTMKKGFNKLLRNILYLVLFIIYINLIIKIFNG